MNNIKRLFLGIAAIALTLSFSAFSKVKTEKVYQFAQVNYGWDEGDQLYRKLTGIPDTENQCDEAPGEVCVVSIDTENPNPPQTLTSAEAISAGATTYPGSGEGSYFN